MPSDYTIQSRTKDGGVVVRMDLVIPPAQNDGRCPLECKLIVTCDYQDTYTGPRGEFLRKPGRGCPLRQKG